MRGVADFRKRLLAWYRRARRPLPWRRTRDPYRIWVSEVMLQQTRVAAVIPYYEKFLERFPDVESLARAGQDEVLALWSGLGYYSRARNLHKAARQIVERGGFPRDYASLRALAGLGDYTAAAVASIAFGLPYAVVDGNVVRVVIRLTAGAAAPDDTARRLLDRARPGTFNQALMELGATLCRPRRPACDACPVAAFCQARRRGLENLLPARTPRAQTIRIQRTLLIIERNKRFLFWRRPPGTVRLAGFWELPEPEQLEGAALGEELGRFRHAILDNDYTCIVRRAGIHRAPSGFHWIAESEISRLPLSTAARKALRYV